MPKFKNRPQVVEAEQWYPGKKIEGLLTTARELVGKPWAHIGHRRDIEGYGYLETINGPVFVSPGDWIVTNKDKVRWVCKPGDFAVAFELVEPVAKDTRKALYRCKVCRCELREADTFVEDNYRMHLRNPHVCGGVEFVGFEPEAEPEALRPVLSRDELATRLQAEFAACRDTMHKGTTIPGLWDVVCETQDEPQFSALVDCILRVLGKSTDTEAETVVKKYEQIVVEAWKRTGDILPPGDPAHFWTDRLQSLLNVLIDSWTKHHTPEVAEVVEPPVVAKVRELLKLRVRGFEDGGPHTTTFTIWNSYSCCFLRMNEKWAVIGHRKTLPSTVPTTLSAWDAEMQRQAEDSFAFNTLGVTTNTERYPGGFVHSNCHHLADALCGLGYLSEDERDVFKTWSRLESSRQDLERVKERARELEKEIK